MRNFILLSLLVLVEAKSDGESHGQITLQEEGGQRQVHVQLVFDSTFMDSPDLAARRIEVRSIQETIVRSAQAHLFVGASSVVLVGESCIGLIEQYPSATDCSEVEDVERNYGPVLLSVFTGSDGSVTIDLERHKRYQLTAASWVSDDDPLCGWGASDNVDGSESRKTLRIVGYCG